MGMSRVQEKVHITLVKQEIKQFILVMECLKKIENGSNDSNDKRRYKCSKAKAWIEENEISD